jgi:hypothetical protein
MPASFRIAHEFSPDCSYRDHHEVVALISGHLLFESFFYQYSHRQRHHQSGAKAVEGDRGRAPL